MAPGYTLKNGILPRISFLSEIDGARPLPVVCKRGVSLLSTLNAFPVRQMKDAICYFSSQSILVSHHLFNAVSEPECSRC